MEGRVENVEYVFDTDGDYKVKFMSYVDGLIKRRENDSDAISNRDTRAEEIKSLTDAYTETVGKLPDEFQLGRLADLLLYEELHDKDRMKVRNNEYPFLSERQLLRRRSEETSDKMYEEYSVDKRNHKAPIRRVRSRRENRLIDRDARIRNKERRRIYREFSKVQPVIVMRKYIDWIPLLEREQNVRVMDDDGGRMLHSEGRHGELLTKEQAQYYFMFNTIMGRIGNYMHSESGRNII
ncbi:hypothetical protein [Bacillus sp. EE-W1]|uniref:hypothetical protein n=1 Tax=Bacillus sp. EE-W1 TaxID=2662453 RepID=UPI0012FC54AA|nr:hypothetical protein [Bacillus sp. EE-W1]